MFSQPQPIFFKSWILLDRGQIMTVLVPYTIHIVDPLTSYITTKSLRSVRQSNISHRFQMNSLSPIMDKSNFFTRIFKNCLKSSETSVTMKVVKPTLISLSQYRSIMFYCFCATFHFCDSKFGESRAPLSIQFCISRLNICINTTGIVHCQYQTINKPLSRHFTHPRLHLK